jgi:hypothetical protein
MNEHPQAGAKGEQQPQAAAIPNSFADKKQDTIIKSNFLFLFF